MFILTDGEVDNPKECLELISNNCEKFKVHSIRIGNYFDRNLIMKLGIEGNGSFHFVNKIKKINSVIIQSLNKCLRPYLYDSKFSLINGEKYYEFFPKDNFCYQDELLNYSFIQKGKKENENIEIQFTSIEKDNKLINKKYSFDNNKIINIPNGEILSKIIIGNILKNNNLSKDEEIDLSTKYQILSKNTTLFSEITNDSKIIGELKKIEEYKKIYDHIINSRYYEDGAAYNDEGAAFDEDDDFDDSPNNECYKNCAPPNEKMCLMDIDDDLIVKKDKNFDKNKLNIKEITLTQDSYDGFWELNDKTKLVIEQNKDIYDKVKQYLSSNNCNNEKVIITFVMIYFLKNEKTINQSEYILIINKGIKFLRDNNFDYEEILKEIPK